MKSRQLAGLGWVIFPLLLMGTLGTPGSAQVASGPSSELSLGDAVKLALEKQPVLRAANSQAAAAAAGVDQALAGFLPRVDFSEGFTRSDNPVYAFGTLLNQ